MRASISRVTAWSQQVDDLEAARVALGYDRIDLLSESAGTRTAMIYAWRYPESIHRSVMIGVNPPGHFMWDPKTTDEQIGRYAVLCSRDASCSTRTDDLAATMQPDERRHARPLALPADHRRATCGSSPSTGSWRPTSAAAPLSGPVTIDAWLAAADGDPSGFWFAVVLR